MPIRLSLRAAAAALLLGAATLPAAAQNYSDDIDQRLERIEQQLRDLQDQMDQGGGTPGGGGGSPQRLNDIELSMRNLTGQVEQFGHDLQTIKDKLSQLETETNFRLNQLEGNPNGKPPADAGPSGEPSGPPPESAMPSDEPGTSQPGPKPPGTIGEVPDLPAGSTAEEIYNQAMDHLTKAEYDAALTLFRQVVENFGTTDYAAQAQYWIADIYYVQKDYERAALAFADVLKKYPEAGRGPEAMLKLGLSLINLGKTKEGCSALTALKQKYPSASDAIVSRAEREAKKAGCSK